MLNSRSTLILQNLILHKKEKSLKELSEELGVSERTVRYELEKISELLSENSLDNIEISKGIVKILNFKSLEEFLKDSYDKTTFSSEERELYILMLILFKRVINQVQLSEELDISRSTIKLHLKNLKETLEKYHLSLEICHKKGLELVGKEEDIRQCLLKFLTTIKNRKNIFFKNILKEYLSVNEEGIKIFLNYCQKIMNRIISDEAYQIIKNYLKITILMVRAGHHIDKIKNENFLENTKEYEAIKKGSTLLEAHYDIELSRVEYLKITDYFLGSHTYNLNYSYYENWVEMEILIKKLITEFNRRVDVDISQDETLIDGLLNHIKPTIYRIQNGIELENSIYQEVLESYPQLFDITSEVLEGLEKFIEKKFTKDEIAFITIHFKAAIDRNRVRSKNKKRALLVCGLGYGTSKLLAQQIKELYSLDIVDIIPSHLLTKSLEKNSIDYIVTTLDLDSTDIIQPIIKVNPLLSNEDMEILESFNVPRRSKKVLFSQVLEVIEKNTTIIDKDNLLFQLKELLDSTLVDDISPKKLTIFDLLDRTYIKEGVLVNTWQEAVQLAGEILEKNGCITKKYTENMIEIIEKYGSYIILAPNIAFPHARNENDVFKTAFSLVTLKKPVLFPNDKLVQAVVAFSSKDNKEHLTPFVQLVEITNEKGFNINNFVKKF